MITVYGEEAQRIARLIDGKGKTAEAEGVGIVMKADVRVRYVEGRTVVEVAF